MTMMKLKTCINDFKRLEKWGVFPFLDALKDNNTIYSTHIDGYAPHLKQNDIYLFADPRNLVVVLLDKCGKRDELADEEPFANEEHPLYFTDSDHRVSPVWHLSETMKMMHQRLLDHGKYVKVYGVLMTESTLFNREDVEDVWETMNVNVIDGLSDLQQCEIDVNENGHATAKQMVDIILEGKIAKPDDSFERMLDAFIRSGCEVVEETGDEDGEDEDDDLPDDIDLPADDPSAADVPSADDDDDDDISHIQIPDGRIEQNQGVNVKVEILRPIANPYEELDKLVGCADIKRRMDELLALTSYNKMMRDLFPDSRQHQVSLHSVFLGRSGTGKTTVCKIFGSLLRKAGALSKGHVVVCDRGTFIGTLWGDEERSLRQVLEIAKGGVLMIDEAYLFNSKHEHDPGRLVIQQLMNILADETQRDIAVVLCGYKEPMERLLETNPGLLSRFPNKFEFTDFSVDELLEITRRRVKEYEYEFTPPAWEKYSEMLSQAYQQRNPETWGNARFIANQLERIYVSHATRCVHHRPADKCQMRMLTPEDILPIEVPKERRKIGF